MGISGKYNGTSARHNLTILGLLPLLKSIQKHCTLKKFSGQTIGIDAYGWLHRGTVACAIELALDKPTTKYVRLSSFT
jgi:exonuclease 1